MRYIGKDKLKEGMILATAIYGKNGKRLLAPNVALTQSYIDRIKNMNFDGVYIYDELTSSIVGTPVIRQQTYQKSMELLADRNYDECMLAANDIVEDLLASESLIPNMTALAAYDRSTFSHSMNVAVTSTLIGMEDGLDEEQLKQIAAAGLLHDIGKTIIPENVLNKPGPLNEEEWEMLKQHPKTGFDMLKDYSTIPAVVKHAVLHHHENYDGSGYPFGKTGNQIHKFAKILHVADVWDALISKRSYKEACCPTEALEYIIANGGTLFDPVYVGDFYRCVHPFAPGITVELSNGERAVVAKNYKDNPIRPDVIIERTGKNIHLLDFPNITITKLLIS
jgi:putative nucleotidyltransferase with HDIG domain